MRALLLLSAVLLSACTANPNASYWTKPGGTMAALRQSELRCKYEAAKHTQRQGFGLAAEVDAQMRGGELHRMCMQVQEGWTLLREPVILPAGT